MSHHKVIIIGTGPAGYTAALYTARANLFPVLFDGELPGGQLSNTTDIGNFPGFLNGISGSLLMNNMREQVLSFNAMIKSEIITKVDLLVRPFLVISEQNEYTCDALIIATGASAKWTGIGKDEWLNKIGGGVSACATCDGFFFRDQHVAVIGGGDTAMEEALFLTKFASTVTILCRSDSLRASKIMQQQVMKNSKIVIKWNTVVLDLITHDEILPSGERSSRLQAVLLRNNINNDIQKLFVKGLFVAIGHKPNTDLFIHQLPITDSGYLKTEDCSTRTIIPGVFACGDVKDSIYRQAITAAGSGCMAAIDADQWLTNYYNNK